MARKKKAAPEGPNNGYLISFGDTMTALLAFFIVLNSLAEEQTGANLHAGTGSFVQAISGFGMPGMFNQERSAQTFQKKETGPQYVAPDENNQEHEFDPRAHGPDDSSDSIRIVDREQELFERFLVELQRLNNVEILPEIHGEIGFDSFEKLNDESPLLGPELQAILKNVAPRLLSPNYEIEIVVWATTPKESAMRRAVEQSMVLRQEAAAFLKLGGSQLYRLNASAQAWIHSDAKRPTVSVVVRKLSAAALR